MILASHAMSGYKKPLHTLWSFGLDDLDLQCLQAMGHKKIACHQYITTNVKA